MMCVACAAVLTPAHTTSFHCFHPEAEGCWRAREQWAPNPSAPLREKELPEGNLPPSGTGHRPPDACPREAWTPLCCSRVGPLILGTFCPYHLVCLSPPPFSEASLTFPRGWLGPPARIQGSALHLCPQCVAWLEQSSSVLPN